MSILKIGLGQQSKNNRQNTGFSLMEVLAALVILGILAGIAIPSSLGLLRRIRLEGAQNEIFRAVRTAQAGSKQFSEAWIVNVFPDAVNPNQIKVAAYPASITGGPTDPLFFDNCVKLRKQCINKFLDSQIRIDSATTTFASTGKRFESGGYVYPPFGTFGVNNLGSAENRCVRISTFLGAVRLSCN